MDLSSTLAQIFGVYILIIGISMLAYRQKISETMKEFMNNEAMQYMSGAVALLVGLILVSIHNVWVSGWQVVITIFAWLSLIKGASLLLLPTKSIKNFSKTFMSTGWYTISGIVAILAGAWLIYIGYFM